mmetsp:Transcript_8801/g.29035  ORF Transcript_8801/g.29035 Transcript_8801/m.29035 type:complete len:215 (+) Transcript_8801:85-729(+)
MPLMILYRLLKQRRSLVGQICPRRVARRRGWVAAVAVPVGRGGRGRAELEVDTDAVAGEGFGRLVAGVHRNLEHVLVAAHRLVGLAHVVEQHALVEGECARIGRPSRAPARRFQHAIVLHPLRLHLGGRGPHQRPAGEAGQRCVGNLAAPPGGLGAGEGRHAGGGVVVGGRLDAEGLHHPRQRTASVRQIRRRCYRHVANQIISPSALDRDGSV